MSNKLYFKNLASAVNFMILIKETEKQKKEMQNKLNDFENNKSVMEKYKDFHLNKICL